MPFKLSADLGLTEDLTGKLQATFDSRPDLSFHQGLPVDLSAFGFDASPSLVVPLVALLAYGVTKAVSPRGVSSPTAAPA